MSIPQKNIPAVFILAGLTGSGKTAMIAYLQQSNIQALDLESMCRHDGSAFAQLQYPSQPSSYQFHKQLLRQWAQFNTGGPVFIESELQKIGRITLPGWLYKIMSTAPVIWLNASKKIRTERIAAAIRRANPVMFCDCLGKLSGKIGAHNMGLALRYFEEGKLNELIEILLTYYDNAAGYEYPADRVILNVDNVNNDFKSISENFLTAVDLFDYNYFRLR